MKILDLLPVVGDYVNEEATKYISKYLLPGTQVDTWVLDRGPSSIEGEYDEVLAAAGVLLKCIEAEKAGYDGIFVDCFGDPGVRAAREAVNIPVFGGFEPIIHYALGTSDKIGIISVLPEVVPMLEGQIAKAGLRDRIQRIRYVDIPVLNLADPAVLVSALLEEGKKAIEEDGVGTIVLGCTAMVGVKEEVEAALWSAGYRVPVMEAGQCAMVMLETFVRMGLCHSGVTYMPPRKKYRTWWSKDAAVEI